MKMARFHRGICFYRTPLQKKTKKFAFQFGLYGMWRHYEPIKWTMLCYAMDENIALLRGRCFLLCIFISINILNLFYFISLKRFFLFWPQAQFALLYNKWGDFFRGVVFRRTALMCLIWMLYIPKIFYCKIMQIYNWVGACWTRVSDLEFEFRIWKKSGSGLNLQI